MRRLVLDLDDVVSESREDGNGDYLRLSAEIESYRQMGFEVVLTSGAGMTEHDGDIGKTMAAVAPELFRLIDELGLVYDEIVLGRPSAGSNGLVLDDKAITPEEFLENDYSEIRRILDDV